MEVAAEELFNSGTIVASANQSSDAELTVSGGEVVNSGTILVAATKESNVSGFIYASGLGCLTKEP